MNLHEDLVGLFRHRPSLAAELLSDVLNVDLPDHQCVRLDEGDCADPLLNEYRADTVVVLSDAVGPVSAVVVEVQLDWDDRKNWSWPANLVAARAWLRCPAMLLVVCLDLRRRPGPPRRSSWVLGSRWSRSCWAPRPGADD